MNAPVYTFRDARLRSPLLRTVNALGSGLGAVGLKLPSLTPEQIAASARTQSNTAQQLDALSSEALARFIESAESDSRMNTLGRLAVKNMLTGALASRFAVLDWHEQHPTLASERIDRPWIIVGLPRTGSSILSILLGLDPLNRPLLQWEARNPIPPSTLASAAEDPRIAEMSGELQKMKALNPVVTTMHPFGSTLAEECTAIFTYSLRTIGMETIAFTPSYGQWLDDDDMSPAYDIHQKTLQALQQPQPTEHWVLKSPNHLGYLPTLMATYPDARVIWTHRDPAKVLPSLASLNCAMQMPLTQHCEPERVGNYWADRMESMIGRATAFDASASEGWCYHLQYGELIKDPMAALSAVYTHFGASMSTLHERRIAAWMEQKPQHADGIHAYDSADFGWSKASLQERFKHYQQRYAVATED
ncbi:MAG: sulfotransferase [Pseudomonadota bacterium]